MTMDATRMVAGHSPTASVYKQLGYACGNEVEDGAAAARGTSGAPPWTQ